MMMERIVGINDIARQTNLVINEWGMQGELRIPWSFAKLFDLI